MEEISRKNEVSSELERIILQEEISWRQKYQALWLKEGDRSTKFFHRVANSYRRSNSIEMLHIDGALCSKATEIYDYVLDYYENLLFEQEEWRPKLDGLSLDSLDSQDATWLERPFEKVRSWV